LGVNPRDRKPQRSTWGSRNSEKYSEKIRKKFFT